MIKSLIKVLTLLVLISSSLELYAEVLNIENAKNYLRWNIFSGKDQLFIKKKNDQVILRTLDVELFQKLSEELKSINGDNKYFSKIDFENKENDTSVLSVKISLKNKFVEVFNFYKDREKKHVLDFWVDSDSVNFEKSAIKKQDTPTILSTRTVESAKNKKVVPVTKTKNLDQLSTASQSKAAQKSVSLAEKKEKKINEKIYRDFRYGAAFIWDYKPILPSLNFSFSLERKTPEFFYDIKDRDFKKNDREAHLQLAINLYRKKKWGLMYKTMKLFGQKYKTTLEEENLIEFLKANAILKDNILNAGGEPVKTAIAMLDNIIKRTKKYELKKGIFKYLLNYYHSKKMLVKALDISKQFYVASKESFDYEASAFAAESIIHTLALLGNYEKLKEVIKEKTIQKIVPAQKLLAYELFTLLNIDNEKIVIKRYTEVRKSLVGPVEPTIHYNLAESFFRIGQYENAIKYFDRFIANNSHMIESGRARVRIALAYELLDKDYKKVMSLYKNAINRTTEELTQLEAKIRYVAFTSVRKYKPTVEDKEFRIFLDRGKSNTKLPIEMEKLLWLVRLRIFINDGHYDKALAYLRALPLKRFNHSIRRVFEGDGAEVIYGLIQDNFTKDNSSKVVALWNNHKEKYVEKVGLDPYLNYLVGRSYIKLGFYNAFDKLIEAFNKNSKKTLLKRYPVWIKRENERDANFLLAELEIIKDLKLENWKSAQNKVKQLTKTNDNTKLNFYGGILFYKNKKYAEAIKEFEYFVSKQSEYSKLEDEDYADLLNAYTDSIYNLGDVEKFKRVSSALLNDFKNFQTENKYLRGIKERVNYLNLEVLASDEKESSFIVETKIKQYMQKYKKSSYKDRVEFLLGRVLIKNNKDSEAMNILQALIDRESVSLPLKEMARSELTLLKIKNR